LAQQVLAVVRCDRAEAETDIAALLGRKLRPEVISQIRHRLGLYFAEQAGNLIDAQWEANGWTEETMEEWLEEHSSRKPQP